MSSEWPSSPLIDVADIRVSNVDKKIHPGEEPVRLCNYLDVYTNIYITNRLDFMEASATLSEIGRFNLKRGDVVITKDSETPDDIGIPAIVVDSIDRLVCGYHLALIRPHQKDVDPVYLAKQLATDRVARYFAVHATGSTRYGLPRSAIERLTIPTPPKPEQEAIARVLTTVDQAIERTELLIAKQKRAKTGLLHDLLSRGIDQHGHLRTDNVKEFKDSPAGRIPVRWDSSTLEHVGKWHSGGTPSKTTPAYWGDEIPWLCPKDMKSFDLATTSEKLTHTGVRYGSREVPANSVFIVVRGMILAHTFPVSISSVPMAFNQDVKAIVAALRVEPRFLAYWFVANAHNLLKITTTATHGTKRFDMAEVFALPIGLPKKDEQTEIVKRLDSATAEITANMKTAEKLRSLKAGLMQDLLTGRKRITLLLADTPEVAAQAS